MYDIGKAIKEYRREHSLSLREFAQMVNLSHAYIDKLEKGFDPTTKKPVYPTTATLDKLSRVISIPLMGNEQLDISDEERPDTSRAEEITAAHFENGMSYEDMTEDDVEKLEAFKQFLIQQRRKEKE